MAYEKQTWANGDVITAEKLNHMEDGIAGAGGSTIEPLEITITHDDDAGTYTANKTFGDFEVEWANCLDEPFDSSVPCTITYNDESSSGSVTTVYNGLAVRASYSDANPGFGLGLIMGFDEGIEYNEDAGGYYYVKQAHGFIFYQHAYDDVIIDMDA